MSDPVTNVEIEDVLASIRRLVSEDSRPEIAAKDVPGKLVLTPALRISDAPGGAESKASAAAATAEAAPAMAVDSPYIPDDNYAEDTEEPQPLESADLEARFADMVEEEDVAADVVAAPVEPAFDAAPMRSVRIKPEPTQPEPVEWEDAVAEEPASAHTSADVGYDAYEIDAAEEEDEAEFVEAPAYDAAGAEAEDDADLDDLSEFGGEEEGILDEETLRELVTDIVRQELQGALGERITRNVRKLVRREIHRALTSHDLQ